VSVTATLGSTQAPRCGMTQRRARDPTGRLSPAAGKAEDRRASRGRQLKLERTPRGRPVAPKGSGGILPPAVEYRRHPCRRGRPRRPSPRPTPFAASRLSAVAASVPPPPMYRASVPGNLHAGCRMTRLLLVPKAGILPATETVQTPSDPPAAAVPALISRPGAPLTWHGCCVILAVFHQRSPSEVPF